MTVNSDRAKAHAAEVAPMMRWAGFRKRGVGFNRATADGVVHVVSLELERNEFYGDPVLTRRYPPQITIAFGVWSPDLAPVTEPTNWITQSRCVIARRVGDQAGVEGTGWWPVHDAETSSRIKNDLFAAVLPFFDLYPDRATVLDAVEAGEGASHPLHLANVFRTLGQVQRARRVLEAHIRRPRTPQQSQYLRTMLIEDDWADLADEVRIEPMQHETPSFLQRMRTFRISRRAR